MTIEVKQLVVKGDIRRGSESHQQDERPGVDLAALKQELVEACRKMVEEVVEDVLRQRRER